MEVDNFMRADFRPDALMTLGSMVGINTSSTRAEIAAAIMALQRPGPCHIATDSQALHDRCSVYLQHFRKRRPEGLRTADGRLKAGGDISPLHRRYPHRRAWNLIKDGDLWGMVARIIGAKGESSIAISKVKAHLDMEHEQKGRHYCRRLPWESAC